MRVIGIDPGSQTTGWGVVEGDGRRYSLVAFGSIRAPSSMKFSTRLLKMCNGLEEVIAEHRPDACALEDAFLATNVKVSMKLGQVRGVVLLVAERAGARDLRVFTALDQADGGWLRKRGEASGAGDGAIAADAQERSDAA